MVVSPFPRFLLSIVLALCSVADLIAARRGALCRYAPNTCVCSFPFLIESLRRPRTLAETVPPGIYENEIQQDREPRDPIPYQRKKLCTTVRFE